MYRRYLGISAVALAGLIALAGNAAAQEKRQGSGERREGASSGERRDGASSGERRESGERRDGGRVEGEFRSGGYYGPYGGSYYGGRGWYGDRGWNGDRGWYGDRGWGSYGYGYPMYDNSSVDYGSDGYYDDGSYGGGRRRGRFGRRRGGDYSYGSYGSGSSCHGGCHGGHYGSSCHGGGYYGAGCTGGHYGATSATNGNAYGAMSANGGAIIQLKVPADATVTFDDQPTQQTGEVRQFITPALEANKNFSYSVHVKSQNMDETRKIKVNPDKQVTMDFTMPQGESQRAAPEQAPAPGRKSYGATKEGAHHEGREAAPAPGAAREGAPAPAPAAKEEIAPLASGDIHEGTVVSFNNGKLEMTDAEHGKHSHQLSPDTKVFIDGQPAKAEDLKADMKIKITNKKGDQQTITRIDAQSKDKNEAQPKSNGAPPKAKNNEAPPQP